MELDTFAFIIHPIQIKKDVARKFPLLGKILTEPQINFFSRYFPPVYLSEVTGIVSASTGRELKGWLIACPFTPPTMMSVPVETAYRKIVACGHMAEELGARLLGLGAYTSVVGDAGVTIADRLGLPVTTGDSYTITMAVEALRDAARVMDTDIRQATIAVVGATGAIGKTCALMLARDCARLVLVGKRQDALEQVREQCQGRGAQVVDELVTIQTAHWRNLKFELDELARKYDVNHADEAVGAEGDSWRRALRLVSGLETIFGMRA